VRFSINDQLCPHDTHIHSLRRPTKPKFHSFGAVSSDGKLFGRMIIIGFSLHSLGEASMVELGHCKGTQIF
jgi:hypothetical protein